MLLPRPLAIFTNQRACLKTFYGESFFASTANKIYASDNWNPGPPNPRCIARDSGDLTRPMRGFKIHFTTCCPWEAVELTRCLFYPGRKRGFDGHAFLEAGTATGNSIFLRFRNSCLRASTPFEIRGSVEVFRSPFIVFLNLAECDTQCSDKVTGTFIGARKYKWMLVCEGINAVTVQIKATYHGRIWM